MCKMSFKCQCAAQLFIWLNCGIASSSNVCQQLNPPGGNTFEGISMGRGGEIGDNLWGWMGLLLLISCSWGSPEMPRFPILVRVTAAGLGCFCYLGLIREFTATWSLGCGSAAWPTSPSNDGNGTGNGEHRGCQKSPGMVNEHWEWWILGMVNEHRECWTALGMPKITRNAEWTWGMVNIGNAEYWECWTALGMMSIGNAEHREWWMSIGNGEQHWECQKSPGMLNEHREYWTASGIMNIGNAKECCPRILAPRISFPKSCPGTGIGVPKSFPGTRNDALRALSLEPGLVFPKAPGLRSQSPSPALEPPVPPGIQRTRSLSPSPVGSGTFQRC